MTASPTGRGRPVAVLLAVLAGLDWWVWLGTDSTYQRDPETGVSGGPWEPPQVIACVLVLMVLALVFRRWLAPGVVVAAVALGFTVPWTVHAAARDSTGMYGVGTVGLLLGIGVGGIVLLKLADAAQAWWRSSRSGSRA